MASRVQKRRGSKTDHTTFSSGAEGELTVEIPGTRGYGTSSRDYGAIHLHYGDGNPGDRIPVGEELNNQVRTVVDETKFLAKLTHFKPLNHDFDASSPNSLPNKFLYAWEEVSIGSTFYDVAQVWTLAITGSAAGSPGDHDIFIPNSANELQKVEVNDVGGSETNTAAAERIYNAVIAATDATTGSIKLASATTSGGVYQVVRDGATLTFTALGSYKGDRATAKFFTTDTNQGANLTITTEGRSYVPQINITNADLGRKSDTDTGGTHIDAAVNINELANNSTFVFPGIRGNVTQDSNGDWPTNARVIPIGGVASYVSGAANNQADTEQVYTAGAGTTGEADYESNSEDGSDNDAGYQDNSKGWRVVDEQVIVEMTERRKLAVGTVTNTTAGRTDSTGVSKMYYFSASNALVGPC
tara:strand:+ start:8524 stop:9768 length:1245 start_codon:yes stop_codon:yes gene_type:complete